MINCDKCTEPATHVVFAAYHTAPEKIHPEVARYPFPMIRSCRVHLLAQIDDDLSKDGTTGQFLLQRLS